MLLAILAEPSVARWWGEPEERSELAAELLGDEAETVQLVIEVDGNVAGGIQYHEELDPDYRHAGIDVYLAARSRTAASARRPCGCSRAGSSTRAGTTV